MAPNARNTGSYWWVETAGSRWDFDDALLRYGRWPKHEGPREVPTWGTDPGPLQDFVWHEMDAWGCSPLRPTTLVIGYTGCVVGI